MSAQIRPNRLTISDRFPMLGFSIRTDGSPLKAEVTLTTDLALFKNPTNRQPDNFFSTLSIGPLHVASGEVVYVVPPEILARFIGADRIYFALATSPQNDGNAYTVQVHPTADSPYVSISGLTGRSLRRVRMFPRRSGTKPSNSAFDQSGETTLRWSGDIAEPGLTEASENNVPSPEQPQDETTLPTDGNVPAQRPAANGGAGVTPTADSAPAPSNVDYDDGFGPMPEQDQDHPADDSAVSVPALALEVENLAIGEKQAVPAPNADTLGFVKRMAARALLGSFGEVARLTANQSGLSIGIGPKVTGGFVAGAELGAGIIFAPGDKLGAYAGAGAVLGIITSISATMQVTILRGGIDSFNGISYSANLSGGEGLVGGASVIFDSSGAFLGVSFELGIGLGVLPVDLYGAAQTQVATQLGYAAAFGSDAEVVEQMGGGAASARRHVPRWRDLLSWTVPAAVQAEVSRRSMSIQTFASADGDLNLDRYEVHCTTLPSGYTATTLLDHIRLNIRDFVDQRNTDFDPYSPADASKWRSSSPVGTVFNLDIIGPDNAAVVASMVEPGRFRFTTIQAPDTGSHPVSGHREFGHNSGENDLIFYTRGADRYTYMVGGVVAFAGADHLWKSFQEKVAAFINSNGGTATVLPRFSERFDWVDASAALAPRESTGTAGQGGASAANGTGGQRGADAQAVSLGGFNPYRVEVKYRMFIPSPAIKGPPLMDDYGGDGRGFSYDGGTSRGEITANVELRTGLGIDSISVVDRHWGLSTAYDSDDTFQVSGKPDWWLGKIAGATPTQSDTLAVSDDNLRIYPGTSGQRGIRVMTEQASAVTIEASGALPLSSIAPNIDADVSVLFRLRNGLIQAKALGYHDGFPAHELYVNSERIYRYDPVTAGNSPTSLFPPQDIDVDGDWVTVARTHIVRTGGQSLAADALEFNQSFTINWDEVQQIAQPTNISCWAAAAAMVVGWRDQISLTPETIAEFASMPIQKGLDPAKVEDLAQALGLEIEYPQSYTPQGFRELLETKGPLWVGAAVPSLHVIVVTGVYNDGQQLFVRITDPWDRVVGTPGSPGPALTTFATGSRYIMTWEAFVAEYEAAAVNYSSVNLQIMHSGSTAGRRPNTGGTVPEGYAAALMDQADHAAGASAPMETPQQVVKISLANDSAPMQPPATKAVTTAAGAQPADTWNALVTEQFSAASVTDLAGIATLATERGWTIAVGPDSEQGFAAGGIGTDAAGDFFRYASGQAANNGASGRLLFAVVEGGAEVFASWTKARAFAASTGATGAVLLNAADIPVGIALRLALASPYGADIATISEAVASAIAAEPETSAEQPMASTPPSPAPTPVPAPAPVAEPVAAAALEADTTTPVVVPPAPTTPTPGLPEPAGGAQFPPPGVRIFRSDVDRGGVAYSLFLMDGTVMPQMLPAVAETLIPGNQIVVNDWPYLDGPTGQSKGGVAIDWSHGQGGVANVRVSPAGGAALDGTSVSVHADIAPGASTPTETKLTVTIRTTFSRVGAEDVVGATDVTLCGSGKHEIAHKEETQPVLIPAQ